MASADYDKYEPDEHVRERPDTYIGDIELITEARWVFNKDQSKMVKKLVKYNPGLEQCVMELITNATDRAQNPLNCVTKIDLSIKGDTITVTNDGVSIPIEIHDKHNVYIPELVFGNMLSSSNFKKGVKRTVGGKNGIGAKAANIFSSKFVVIIVNNNQKYVQTFTNQMREKSTPKITKVKAKDSVTIEYTPALSVFGMKTLDENDTIKLIEKRTVDASAVTNKNVIVTYNGKKIQTKNFEDYINLYIGTKAEAPRVFIETERWSVAFALNPHPVAVQVSFVNGIGTEDGGSHVAHVLEPVLNRVVKELSEKHKDLTIRKSYIKDNIIVFVKAVVENPTFTSQTKREHTTRPANFGSKLQLNDETIKKIIKLGITKGITEIARAKEMKDLKKIDGKKVVRINDIEKLDDANWAGGARSSECTLILTEGDSAKATAIAGLSVVGKDTYGVFPLKGKLLNVRDQASKRIEKNEEIVSINKILGLAQGMKDIAKLRYGKIMIMADQDSVKGDTPLLLRKDGKIVIKNIEDMYSASPSQRFAGYSASPSQLEFEGIVTEKEYSKSDYEVWSELGWTKIKHVMRHNTTKQIYRVLTHTGCVDVTEDHSLLDHNAEKIKPTECKVGTELLHSFPGFEDLGVEDFITPEEAWVMGLFCADGNCGFGEDKQKTNNWVISNCNLELLEKAKNILTDIYEDCFEIYEDSFGVNRLSLLRTKTVNKYIIEKYRKMCYYKKWKYIHPDILNSTKEVRQSFYDGYYEGDGKKAMDVNGKITSQCLYFLSKSLGYNISINHNHKKDKVYSMTCSKGKYQKSPTNIKKIIPLGIANDYVYDLETENHHFQGGVGEIILHNTDGWHIKGLIMNYIACFWPDMLSNNLVCSLLTPIVKIFKGNKVKCFYNIEDFDKWRSSSSSSGSWRVKYYKGLGTSSDKEAREYFSDLATNKLEYTFDKSIESEDSLNLELAFSESKKVNTDKRKEWITNTMELVKDSRLTGKPMVDYTQKIISVRNFVKGELALHSVYDNHRSIPHFMDGLKPSQRKILFSCLKRNLFLKADKSGEIKVAQLSGYVSEHSGYHHGEASLQGAIVNMAQNYTGSNNMNILYPSGQFGTRIKGGKDASSPRYIFTYLNEWVKKVFDNNDNKLLNYLDDDGSKIEPDFYVPTIPLLLVNGSDGIGTGWSTTIPCYNPTDIVANLRKLVKNEENEIAEMNPWYRGFKGSIVKKDAHTWVCSGVIRRCTPKSSFQDVEINELPIGLWFENFKSHLNVLEQQDKIVSFVDHSTTDKVKFRVTFRKLYLSKTSDIDIIKLLKLVGNIKDSNMHAFQCDGTIKKYECAEEILWDFYQYRKEFYVTRKKFIETTLVNSLTKLSEKMRFIQLVMDGELVVFKRRKIEIVENLETLNFSKIDNNYDYLINISLSSFTQDRLDDLEKQIVNSKEELCIMESKSSNDLWIEDLDSFESFGSYGESIE
jgi:DNA gyrase/topoisomerase IV subunit B